MLIVTMEYDIYVSNNWVITISVTLTDADLFATGHRAIEFQWIFKLRRKSNSSQIAFKNVVFKIFVAFGLNVSNSAAMQSG